MPNYDFSTLSSDEFERLVADLLSAEMSVRVERFKPGKDSGIDGKFYLAPGIAIIQAKHYRQSGWAPLLRRLRSDELPKVQRLDPDRYILATSVGLSPDNKSEIIADFAPYILGSADVFGRDDVNDLLARHPDVERAHYKLWLSSVNILVSLLHNAIEGRSQFALEKAFRAASRYVVTSAHHLAVERLQATHTLIVTGAAGVGKTTLATQICLQLANDGYQFCSVEDDLKEAEAAYKKGEKQVFFFDDFFGRNFLEIINNKEDSHVLAFIDRVNHDPSKRFLLTSRTAIINRAKQISEPLRNANISDHFVEIEIKI